MILCVTLNPCLDKTLSVPPWKPGENVRGRGVREVVGGKGNNVARALARLGRSVRPATFLGGAVGDRCERLLREDDRFDPIIVPVKAETRVILTVRTQDSAEQTAFFDPDPLIDDEEAETLTQKIQESLKNEHVEALALSGSSPSPATHGLFADWIALAKTRRVPVFLDTYGPALAAVWGFRPDALKLNRREASGFLRVPDPSNADLERLLDDWAKRGTSVCLITDGPGPVLARVDGQRLRAVPPRVEAVNPIGSGDCVLAGLIDARLQGLNPEASLRRALACGVANALVWDAGAIDPDTVDRLEARIVVESNPAVS